jgi:hypothetical protein
MFATLVRRIGSMILVLEDEQRVSQSHGGEIQ